MNSCNDKDRPNPSAGENHPQPTAVPSRTLFQNGNELLIEHAGQHYRLRITRQNKLILTK